MAEGARGLQFTETQLSASTTVLYLTARSGSATLEMHPGYYTYYWPCRIGPNYFLTHIASALTRETTSLTVIDDTRGLQQIPFEGKIKEPLAGIRSRDFDNVVSLLRLDGPSRSLVWQYAPGQQQLRERGRSEPARLADGTMADIFDTFSKDGLDAYAGCASTADHINNFKLANVLMRESATDAGSLVDYLDFFERYLTRWVKRK